MKKIEIFFILIFILFPFFTRADGGTWFNDAPLIGPGFYETKDMLPGDKVYYYVNLLPGQSLELTVTLVPKGAGIGRIYLYDENKSLLVEKEEMVDTNSKSFNLSYLVNSEKETHKIYIEKECDFFGLSSFSLTVRIDNYFDVNSQRDAPENKENAIPVSYGIHQGFLSGNSKVGNDKEDFYKISIQNSGDFYINAKPLSEKSTLSVTIYDPQGNLVLQGTGYSDKELKASRYLTKLGDYIIKIEGRSDGILPYQFELLPRKAEIVVPRPSIFEKIKSYLRYTIGIFLLVFILYFFGKKIYNILFGKKSYY